MASWKLVGLLSVISVFIHDCFPLDGGFVSKSQGCCWKQLLLIILRLLRVYLLSVPRHLIFPGVDPRG